MKSKERVLRALEFRGPDRVPIYGMHAPAKPFIRFLYNVLRFRSDIQMTSVIYRRKRVDDEHLVDPWGAIWRSLGNKGEVVGSPLKTWDGLETLKAPQYITPQSLKLIKTSRRLYPNRFLIGNLPDMIFSRCHYLRGYVPFMEDLYDEPEKIKALVDIIVKLNLELIDMYAAHGVNGVMGADDLGLQNSLMISPALWREIFKPGYAAMIKRAHERGMKFILHSCGYIIDIIGDFVEIGLDALQCDQQDNMGIENLNARYGGKITFFSPTDIQTTLSTNDPDKIRAKARELRATLGSHNGGLIGKMYPTPKDIGATEKSVTVMLKAFLE